MATRQWMAEFIEPKKKTTENKETAPTTTFAYIKPV
jgi:hypothetical protein